MEKVYLKINEKGETENVYSSLGMAICGIEQETRRINPELITKQTLTELAWKSVDGKEHSVKILECPVCEDIKLDYMNMPRPVSARIL